MNTDGIACKFEGEVFAVFGLESELVATVYRDFKSFGG